MTAGRAAGFELADVDPLTGLLRKTSEIHGKIRKRTQQLLSSSVSGRAQCVIWVTYHWKFGHPVISGVPEPPKKLPFPSEMKRDQLRWGPIK